MKYSTIQFITRLYKRITIGKVQKKMSLYDLKKESYKSLVDPFFVLSTGRSRTHWLTSVLSEVDDVSVLHNPEVSFLEEGKLIYELGDNRWLGRQLVCTARDHIWLDYAKRNKQFVETNNRITFAVPIIKELIPHSKFIHLTRHPIDFIRSGLNRKWYEGGSHDLGRITMNDQEEWEKLSSCQKIGWLWLETNKYIIDHTSDISKNRIYTTASEELDIETMKSLFKFMKLNTSDIPKKWFAEKTNEQKNKIEISDQGILEDLKEAFFFDSFKKYAEKFGYEL